MSSEEEMRRRGVENARREQRERSDRARRSNDLGRLFHKGIAEIRGETRQNGWQSQRSVRLPDGRERIHDNARTVNDHEFREYKDGQVVGGEFVMEQISKERTHLRSDPKAKGAWIVREGAPDSAARRKLEALEREFPNRFELIELTKGQADRAVEVGKTLERSVNQLELFDSGKLRAQQRAKEIREKAQAKQRVQESVQRYIEAQDRERKQREAQELALKRQREAATRLTHHAREEREARARGEKPPMTGREVPDVRAVSFPDPASDAVRRPPYHGTPTAGRSRGKSPGRDRVPERDR